jgi:hypothetical protein
MHNTTVRCDFRDNTNFAARNFDKIFCTVSTNLKYTVSYFPLPTTLISIWFAWTVLLRNMSNYRLTFLYQYKSCISCKRHENDQGSWYPTWFPTGPRAKNAEHEGSNFFSPTPPKIYSSISSKYPLQGAV